MAGLTGSGWRKRGRSALHNAADVKKWIPSIKNEIEYCLEQSQLVHYSERKIQEFQERIETLKKEYQSYLWKLRRLDPSYKEHPWKLRGYTRKRAADEKAPSWIESGEHSGAKLLCTPILNSNVKNDQSDSEDETSHQGEDQALTPTCSEIDPETQDKPLVFDTKKSHPKDLWSRSSYKSWDIGVERLKDILLSHHQDQQGNSGVAKHPPIRTEGPSTCDIKGIPGLGCYSSSEEDS
ncbi:uncharacterized protein O3C94_015919 isoform 2-T2 [Discoglossus pictus]